MIVLASSSWLRKTIMEKSGLAFRVEAPDVDERAIENQHPGKTDEDIVVILAAAKAEAMAANYADELVIAADSFAVMPSGERQHKPGNYEDAVKRCVAQSGQTIRVFTGVAMAYRGQLITGHTTTDITYTHFDRATVEALLHGDEATIRNGGLGFFADAPGFTLVESFNGSYTGAMGLPMEIIRDNIAKLGYLTEN